MSTQTQTLTNTKSKIGIRTIVQVAMLAAISAMLMVMFEIPLPFAPSFYEIDLSEVPVMIGTFTMGPVAGAIIELVKILLKLILTGSHTMGVGELANFLIGCGLCVPAGIIYRKNRSRKGAVIGMAVGTLFMTAVGCLVNAFILLPLYSQIIMPIDKIIDAGTAVNGLITNLSTFVIYAVAPFNITKGILVSLIVFLIYKRISPVFKISHW